MKALPKSYNLLEEVSQYFYEDSNSSYCLFSDQCSGRASIEYVSTMKILHKKI